MPKRFPNAQWMLTDMRQLALSESFDAVIAWHSLFHLPPDDQCHVLPALKLEKFGVIMVVMIYIMPPYLLKLMKHF